VIERGLTVGPGVTSSLLDSDPTGVPKSVTLEPEIGLQSGPCHPVCHRMFDQEDDGWNKINRQTFTHPQTHH
jgi:hypothetical protein